MTRAAYKPPAGVTAKLTSVELDVGEIGDEPPKEIRLFAAGENSTKKGTFVFDEASAVLVMTWFEEGGVDLPIDYDHAMADCYSTERKVAAGWFRLEVRDGELWAVGITWTPEADKHLRDKEYRYFSPWFEFDPASGRVLRLFNFALTNLPAMNGIPALIAASATAQDDRTKETNVNEEQLKAQVADLTGKLAAANAELTSVRAKLTAIEAESDPARVTATLSADSKAGAAIKALVELRTQVLSIAGKTNVDEAIGVLGAHKAAAGELATVKAEAEKAKQATLSAEFEKLLGEGSKAGKISPAPTAENMGQRGYWDQAVKDLGVERAVAQLRAFLPGATAQVQTTVRQPGSTVTLSEQDRKLNKQLGIKDEDFIAAEEKRLQGR